MSSSLEHVPPVEVHSIRSKYVQQTFKVQVMQPVMKEGEITKWPVVYATDGNFAFDALKGISHSIQRTGRDTPRFMLVGIGYPSDSPFGGSALRVRDFTFLGCPALSPKPPLMSDVPVVEPGTRDFGGAEDFQQFIEHELIPLVDDKYATATGERTYFGHSGGGGFGLFTLFTRPHLFDNYIISSPSLAFNGETPSGIRYDNHDFLLEDARRFIASGRPLDGIKAYMSVGAEEEFESGLQMWQLSSSFFRMAALMKAARIPGLQLKTEIFPAETHMTVWPVAFMHGLKAVLNGG